MSKAYMEEVCNFDLSDFESGSSSDILVDFIDENEFHFPELDFKYNPSSQNESPSNEPSGSNSAHLASPRSPKRNDSFEDLCGEFGGLEEMLTASPNANIALDDLLSVFESPIKIASSESETAEDEPSHCLSDEPTASPEGAMLSLASLQSLPSSQNEMLSVPHAFPTKLTKSSKRQRKKKNELLREQQKMYIKCLQEQVSSLLSKQSSLEKGNPQIIMEPQLQQSRIRKTHVQMFLTYRTNGIIDRNCWSELLDEAFTLTLPCTPFCQVNGQVIGNKRRLYGIDAVVKDTCFLSSFVESLSLRCHQLKSGRNGDVRLVFSADACDILIVGDKTMCHWKLSTQGLVQFGFPSEAEVDGMMYCRFTNQHKLSCMEMTFDVFSFTQQLTKNELLEVPAFPFPLGASTLDSKLSMNFPHLPTGMSMMGGTGLQNFQNIPFCGMSGVAANTWPHTHSTRTSHSNGRRTGPKILPAKKSRGHAMKPTAEGILECSMLNHKGKGRKKRKIAIPKTEPKKIQPCPIDGSTVSSNQNFAFNQAFMCQMMMNAAAAFGQQAPQNF